jgi:16S rRNA (cytosine967-C5)-methyltransferase
LPYSKDGAKFGDLFALQAQLLDHAVSLLAAGGRMVYCTCSLFPDEGECQIDDLLASNPAMSVDRSALDRDDIDPAWITSEGGLRLTPDIMSDQGGMDGFYMCVLTKAE